MRKKTKAILVVKGDAYVDSCFNFDFNEQNEKRIWYEMDELNERNSDTIRKMELAEAALPKYPDYDIIYAWIGWGKKESGQPEEARKAYLEGLMKSRRKSGLCGDLGMLEFEPYNNLHEAVKWWIRSCAIQSVEGQYSDGFSFLNLATIAKYLRLKKCYSKLFEQSKKIQNIIFDAAGESQRKYMVRDQGNNLIKQAITLLCKNYL